MQHPDLPPRVIAKAREVACSRCAVVVVDSPSVEGTTMVNFYAPTSGMRRRAVLCGACGLLLREFLYPRLVDDPDYRAVAAELRSRW
jgi:hypothetical protein